MKSIACLLVASLLASCTALPHPLPYPYPMPGGGHPTQPTYSESRLYPDSSASKGNSADKLRTSSLDSTLKTGAEAESAVAQETLGLTYWTYPSYPTYTYVTPVPPTAGPYYYPNYPGYVVL